MALPRARKLLVDVHTHLYLESYMALLRARTSVPKVVSTPDKGDRLVILDDEPSGGRPIGPEYYSREEKLRFMDRHGIDISVVSLANPWLHFLSPSEAVSAAKTLNDDIETYCSSGPPKRLYAFGVLPLAPDVPIPALLSSIAHLASLPKVKGLILGSRGLGKGLDDPALDVVWEKIAEAGLMVFLHPHYGLGSGAAEAWGEQENGHVLPLALGFPFETTIAITRLILSGVFDRHPTLKIMLAHSGGALPQLSSRLASCVAHDPLVASRLKHDPRYYLALLYLDAVSYGPEELEFVSKVIGRGASYATGAQSKAHTDGTERIMWGTDHPFFPPIAGEKDQKWMSVTENLEAVRNVARWTEEQREGVRGANAVRILGLDVD